MKVGEVMIRNPICVAPDTPIEEAATIMREHKIGDLLVVENDKLVGIITQTDLFEAIVNLFGFRRPGTRITVEVEDKVGVLHELAGIIKEAGINIINVATRQTSPGKSQVVLRLNVADGRKIAAEFERHGFKVIHMS